MLENYKIDNNGVIKQISVNKFDYGFDYSNNYNKLGELGKRMAYLRIGHLIGSIGYIPNSILDIGYGNGDFIGSCVDIIKECYAHDISNYPVPNNVSFISNIFEREFDVVTFYDVLEHYENIEWINKLNTKYIVISLPCCHYFNDEWFKNWKHRKPDEHIWHFNEKSLLAFMGKMGYININISCIEDTIRKNNENYSNIITGIFMKNNKLVL